MDSRTAEFIVRVAKAPRQRVTAARGDYLVWHSRVGAEIWLHYPTRRTDRRSSATDAGKPQKPFDPIDDLMGMTVVHSGMSDLRTHLVRTLATAPDNPMDGIGIATLGSRRAGDKPLTFTFELVSYATERLLRPADVRLRVTALAQRVWAHPTVAAYLAATPARRLIACGGIADVTPADLPDLALIYKPKPGALWLLSGTVRRSMRLVNPITSAPYYLIALETDRGLFDVVANPAAIEGDISDGHVMQVVASVSGRVLERIG